jgi:hypothetical protein
MAHFKENQDHMAHLRASGAHQDTVDFVQNCHDEIIQLLDGLNEVFQPYPDGECLFFYMFNDLLIYLDQADPADPADPAIASPLVPEGAPTDDDGMMVDDDCK